MYDNFIIPGWSVHGQTLYKSTEISRSRTCNCEIRPLRLLSRLNLSYTMAKLRIVLLLATYVTLLVSQCFAAPTFGLISDLLGLGSSSSSSGCWLLDLLGLGGSNSGSSSSSSSGSGSGSGSGGQSVQISAAPSPIPTYKTTGGSNPGYSELESLLSTAVVTVTSNQVLPQGTGYTTITSGQVVSLGPEVSEFESYLSAHSIAVDPSLVLSYLSRYGQFDTTATATGAASTSSSPLIASGSGSGTASAAITSAPTGSSMSQSPSGTGTATSSATSAISSGGYSLNIHNPAALDIDNTTQYAGYLTVGKQSTHKLFFWFFESRGDPANDPVVLWLNGGPGCSSLEGLLFENGPSRVNTSINLERNPYSWNNRANVIYLDEPIGVGFSYATDGSSISTTTAAAVDVVSFMHLFFLQFPQYSNHKVHVAGESYAGHYIPQVANDILSTPNLSFNLTSIIIGNGITDPLTQFKYYQPMACGQGGVPAVLNGIQCGIMSATLGICIGLIQACYNDPENTDICVRATETCQNSQIGPVSNQGTNPYDLRTQCASNTNGLCYAGLNYVQEYLNQPDVQSAIGVSNINFQSCSDSVNTAFTNSGDWMMPYVRDVPTVLNAGIPVLIYAGDQDFICNWLGNQAWTKNLQWNGAGGYSQASPKSWVTSAGHVGDVTNYQGFSFLRVFGAGHLVPYDQPHSAMSMLNQWLDGDYSFSATTY